MERDLLDINRGTEHKTTTLSSFGTEKRGSVLTLAAGIRW